MICLILFSIVLKSSGIKPPCGSSDKSSVKHKALISYITLYSHVSLLSPCAIFPLLLKIVSPHLPLHMPSMHTPLFCIETVAASITCFGDQLVLSLGHVSDFFL